MAYITAPDFRIKSIDWSLDRPGQSNVSAWTGKRTAAVNPWHSKWSAHVELAMVQGEAGFRALRSFFVRCKGTLNTFRIYAVVEPQNSNSGVTVSVAAAQGATSVSITGAATALLDGQMLTINGQLLQATSNQSGSAVTFEPPLRKAAALGTKVVTSRPYALVHLAASAFGYNTSPGRLFSTSFDVEEAILEADGTVPE